MINYQQIIEDLEIDKIKQLLDSFNIPWEDKENYLIMPTVCHNDDIDEASHKLYFYKDTHIFYCYTECGAMSIFQFLKNYYDTRNITYDWYTDILQVILNCSTSSKVYQSYTYKQDNERFNLDKPKEIQTYPNGIIDSFVKYYPIEWIKDNITPQTMDKFNIRFSTDQNKIIIPHYNASGALVGIRGRALNEWEIENLGKYMPVQIENKWYSHPLSLNLYGLNVNKENIKKNGICYLVEAEKSVMQADNFSEPNCCVAVCGSNLNRYHIKLLFQECMPSEIIVAFDNEEKEKSHEYFDKLWSMCDKYRQYTNISFIYDKYGLTSLKDSPTDKGEEVFRTLVERRIQVK